MNYHDGIKEISILKMPITYTFTDHDRNAFIVVRNGIRVEYISFIDFKYIIPAFLEKRLY